MKFKVGDKVWAKFTNIDFPQHLGEHPGIVVSTQTMYPTWYPYMIEIPPSCPQTSNGYWYAPEDALRPRNDDDRLDTRETGQWEVTIYDPHKTPLLEILS